MEISGKLTLFVEEKKGKENTTFKTFSTTISSKGEDGKYLNKSIEVRFNRDNITEAQTNKLLTSKCYTLEVENAWLSVRKYTTMVNEAPEDKKVLYIFIDQATIKEAKDIKKPKNQDNDLPF